MTVSVLLIDDERSFRVLLERALVREGYEVRSAGTGAEARRAWAEATCDLVVVDRNLPDGDGIELLHDLRVDADDRNLDVAFLMVTAYADVEHAVEALKRGADDYITKPVQLPDLLIKLQKAIERRDLQRRVRALRLNEPDVATLLGRSRSAAMQGVLEMARRVAESPDTPVHIRGESGVGKELLARFIHATTPTRSEASFVELNCAALTEQLVESELFGHEKGAFTDAREAKRGLFEIADGGTLFLDEVADLGLGIQAKLLRVLETMRFRRVGGTQDRSVDVRILSATNRDLARAVEDGEFRLDLYHRLDVFQLDVPPLRERAEDLLPLAERFIDEIARRLGRPTPRLTADAIEHLRGYPFPGNVRELRNVIERAVILERGPSLSASALVLGTARTRPDASSPFFRAELRDDGEPPTLKELERAYVAQILELAEGNKTRAAKLLGITFPTIAKKINDYDL
ncbi:MAG: sigma-54-dependent Fis family transcriptional regulator [Sandaracinaceae bacterium]|nr:sigma-54-dependent Fis family transcriptional regulator [Sandaracinaceae bacterium]